MRSDRYRSSPARGGCRDGAGAGRSLGRLGLVAMAAAVLAMPAAAPGRPRASLPLGPEPGCGPELSARPATRAEDYVVVLGGSGADFDKRRSAVSARAVEALDRRLHERLGDKILLDYEEALNGFLAALSAEDLGFICREAAAVGVPVSIARDEVIELPPMVEGRSRRLDAKVMRLSVSSDLWPPLGLDRIDQRLLELDFQFNPSRSGLGVHVYVIDSGIYAAHDDFKGVSGLTRVVHEVVPQLDTATAATAAANAGDCLGHGTAVASIIGGKRHGIARKAALHSVRVFGCANTTSVGRVIKAVDWVTGQRAAHSGWPMVVNMSVSSVERVVQAQGETSSVFGHLNSAVENSIKKRITYVIAAGNNSANSSVSACNVSPALVLTAITVSNTVARSDGRSTAANQGPCVDIFAPGVDIDVAGRNNPTEEKTLSGTSMAAPHAAGVAALILEGHQGYTATDVWNAIDFAATTRAKIPAWCGIANIASNTQEKLLHWGSGSADGRTDEFPKAATPACGTKK